jgi:putative transposase
MMSDRAVRLEDLTASNVFAMLRLLAMDDRYTNVEILALRQQIAVLERQLDK